LITGPTGVWINSISIPYAFLLLVFLRCLWKEISCGIPYESSSWLQFIKEEIKSFLFHFVCYLKKKGRFPGSFCEHAIQLFISSLDSLLESFLVCFRSG
jgi:hypothetical protein